MAVNPPKSDTGIVLPKSLAKGVRSQTPASGFDNGTKLRNDAQSTANKELSSYRGASTAAALTRVLVATDAIMSTSAVSMTALATCPWKVAAYTTGTQEFSPEGLVAVESIISRLDTRYDYTTGFSSQPTLAALIETAIYDIFQTGGIGMELVLDKQKLPSGLVLFAYDKITKVAKDGGWVPSQRDAAGGPDVVLDFPTIFVGESLMSLDRIMAVPMAHPGSNRNLAYTDFIQDAWKTLKRVGMGRLAFTLDYQKVVASAPADVQTDPAKLSAYLGAVKAGVETELSNLAPEDVLVHYDLGTAHQIGATGEKADIAALLPDLAGMAASAAKSSMTALGLRGGGSQNVASTEALISTKVAALLQRPVQDVLSQALTLAIRLFGVDAYVEFRFNGIELRPKTELAAHRSMDTNRILELLSLGRITDEEAQLELGLGSLPSTAEKLSGTGFYSSKAADTVPASGTNALNRTNKVDGPSSGGGTDNEQRP